MLLCSIVSEPFQLIELSVLIKSNELVVRCLVGSAMMVDNSTQTRLHPEWAYCNVSVANILELLAHVEPRFVQVQNEQMQLSKNVSEDEDEQSTPVSCKSARTFDGSSKKHFKLPCWPFQVIRSWSNRYCLM